MPTQVTNYQCPTCTGPLHFVGDSGKLECGYCGGQFEVAEIEALYAEKEAKAQAAFADAQAKTETAGEPSDDDSQWNVQGSGEEWGADSQGMKAYSCPSCGAELICDETSAATSCPYCGNPSIVPGQFGGTMKPDYIIPFKLDKEAAKEALKKHYKGKFLLPKAFTTGSHIEELKGLYVPFWLYNANAAADCTFDATRSTSYTQGDEEVTITEHYRVRRAGTVSFERIPADGSKKMPDDYMDSIEPFDYEELKPFSTAYLPGYLADKYDVTAQDNAPRADARCKNSAVELMRDDVTGYETVITDSSHVQLDRGDVNYALMPVWTLLTKWNGKDYMFMMNGQTGKLVGDLPVSKGKYWGLFAGMSVVLGALLSWAGVGAWIASIFMG